MTCHLIETFLTNNIITFFLVELPFTEICFALRREQVLLFKSRATLRLMKAHVLEDSIRLVKEQAMQEEL